VPGEGGSRWSSAANRTSPAGRRGSRFPADHSSCRPPIRSCAGRRTRVEPPPPAAPPVAPSLPRPVVGGGAEAEQQQRLGEGWILRLRSAYCCCWIQKKCIALSLPVRDRQMEVCLSILLVVVGLSLPKLSAGCCKKNLVLVFFEECHHG
jgi:hypothetical protein